jgi:hypothetical protein
MLLCAIGPYSAFACSPVSVAASTAEAVRIGYYYWIASALLAIAVIYIEVACRRLSLILVVAAALAILHPAWMMSPGFFPNCKFQNVEASKAVLFVLCAMLIYQSIRLWRLSRRRRYS